jgi:predicted ATPase
MITRAKFQNFKALRDVEITFDSRLTVLVGPNGSGKTSVLQGIQFLGRFAYAERLPNHFLVPASQHISQLVWGWQETPQFAFDRTALHAAIIELQDTTHDKSLVVCRYAGPETKMTQFLSTLNGGQIDWGRAELSAIRSATLLRLDSAQLAMPSLPERLPPRIATDGGGLPTLLAYLLRKYPEQFQAIIKALQQVIPNVSNIRLDLVEVQRIEHGQATQAFADVLLFDFPGSLGIPATSVSDGTLFVLGLLTVLLNPDRPRLILLDDLDHRLHPKAQMDLIELLRKLLDQFADLQIIATSHSPYILDKLKPNEVRVMALKDDGTATWAKLEDHPKFPMWKNSMSPGEFWSHAGEDWVKKLHAEPVAP